MKRSSSSPEIKEIKKTKPEATIKLDAASAQTPNRHGQYPLHIAVAKGKIDKVTELLAQGADVNQPLVEKGRGCFSLLEKSSILWSAAPPLPLQHFTPLMIACKWGRVHIAELLIQQGAQINAVNAEGLTAVHVAAKNSQIEILKMLFAKKAFLAGWYATESCERPVRGSYEPVTLLNRFDPYKIVTPVSIAIENLDAELLHFLLTEENKVQAEFKALNWNFISFKDQILMRYRKELSAAYMDDEEIMLEYKTSAIHWIGFAEEDNALEFSETLKILLQWGFDINQPNSNQYKDIKKWAIIEPNQLKSIKLSNQELHTHFRVLSAYFIASPQDIDDSLRALIADALIILMNRMLAENQFNVEDFRSLRIILENPEHLNEQERNIFEQKYLFIYRQIFGCLPELKLLALEKLLLSSNATTFNLSIMETEVIKTLHYAYPFKTKKLTSSVNSMCLPSQENVTKNPVEMK